MQIVNAPFLYSSTYASGLISILAENGFCALPFCSVIHSGWLKNRPPCFRKTLMATLKMGLHPKPLEVKRTQSLRLISLKS